MHRRQQPEIQQPDEQHARQHRPLHDVEPAPQHARAERPTQARRHPARQRLAGPGKRDQERAEMMHRQMLHAIEREQVQGRVFVMRLQHGVDRAKPEPVADAAGA